MITIFTYQLEQERMLPSEVNMIVNSANILLFGNDQVKWKKTKH